MEIGAIGGLLSGVMGAAGSIMGGDSAAAATRANGHASQMADFANIMMLEKAKQVAHEQAAYEAWTKESQTTQTVAEAQGGIMQNGLDMGGSNLAVVNQLRDIGHHEAMMAVYNGDMKAYNLGLQQTMTAMHMQSVGQVTALNAQSQQTAGIIGGASKLISAGIGAFSPKGIASNRLSVSDQMTV